MIAPVNKRALGAGAAAIATALAFACGGSPSLGRGSNDYLGAVVTAGAAVAMAGANRAVTGDCWAQCRNGMMCDRDSGTCVALPCGGACPGDWTCQRVGNREECVQPTVKSQEVDMCPVADASILLRAPCVDSGRD
jgi:hypothetical protein